MKRLWVALCLSLVFSLGLLPVVAQADQPYSLLIDGRPLTSSATESGATLRDGVLYVNVVPFTKAFNGLLTFSKNSTAVRVTINRRTGNFVNGQLTSDLNGMPVKLSGAPFAMNGDTYVPLRAIAAVARATVRFDKASSTAYVSTAYHAPPVAPTSH
jgi:hypothetical protein